jgi:toxin FitB
VNGWLLDTNIISAFGPGKRPYRRTSLHGSEPGARRYTCRRSALPSSNLVSLNYAEPDLTGAENLRQWLDRVFDDYADRILTFDLAAARIAGVLGEPAQANARYPSFADIAIAAIAKARELVLVTLNRHHFDPLRLAIFNPFAPH